MLRMLVKMLNIMDGAGINIQNVIYVQTSFNKDRVLPSTMHQLHYVLDQLLLNMKLETHTI